MATEKFKWQGIVKKYAFPETWRSVWQISNSLIPFIVLWYLAYRSLEVGYWLVLVKPLVVWAVIRAVGWNIRNLPDTWREHRRIQRLRRVSDAVILRGMVPFSNKFRLLREQIAALLSGLDGRRPSET